MDAMNRVRSCKEQQFSLLSVVVFIYVNIYMSSFHFNSQVLEVLAAIRNEDKESLAEKIFNNTMKMFFPEEAPVKD